MNNDFEMPSLKKEEEDINSQEQMQNEQGFNQQKIEIPQKYYDKLDKEKEERLQALAKKEEEHQTTVQSGGMVILIILSFIICFGLLYGMLHVNKLLILGLPIYVVLGSLISGSANKENSKFGVSILVSCMLGALVCFILGMSNKAASDKYIYYAYAFFAVAFMGYSLSMAIIKLLFDKEVKAMGKLFSLLVIALVFGVPFYFYNTKKIDFMSIVFKETKVIGAATQEEYIEKVLKNRYGIGFTCDNDAKKNYIDAVTHKRTMVLPCASDDGRVKSDVMSLFYDEDNKQYIVKDFYINNTYVDPLRKELQTAINGAVSSKSVSVAFFPDNKCFFIGDCEGDKEYEKEMDLDNLHKYSDELRLQDYIGINNIDFFNKYKFEYDVVVKSSYAANEDFELMVKNIVDILEQKGLKNYKGFNITMRDTSIIKDVYKVSGKADASGSFRNYQVVND